MKRPTQHKAQPMASTKTRPQRNGLHLVRTPRYRRTASLTLLLIAVLFFTVCHSAYAQSWSAFRGDAGTGVFRDPSVGESAEGVSLSLKWKVPLGSGYSSPVVSSGRVVTLFTDGVDDLAGCFDASSGEEVWRRQLGPMYVGENGSFDGPISTPLIQNGAVFCLTANGKFFSLNLSDGNVNWQKDLVADYSGVKPGYGFATSPIFSAGTLILQTGGEETSLTGIDPATGSVKWTCTNDRINSQSPTLMAIDGKEIVLAAGGKMLVGVEPASGEVLFEYEHGATNGSAMVPVVFDEDKVLLTTGDRKSKSFSIEKSGVREYEVSPEWETRGIKNTYNVPVVHDDYIYAYSTRILTCIDASDGNPVWKSREPGDGFLIVVNGNLLTVTKNGGLFLAQASPDGYSKLNGLELFDDLVWALPAYSEGRVFVRSLGELACVEIGASAADASATGVAFDHPGSEFSNLLKQIESAPEAGDAQTKIDRWLATQQRMPVVENDHVIFVYQGTANDVAVASDAFGARQERKMTQIDGTNVFYYAMPVGDNRAARCNYCFLVDYKPQTDPRNPDSMTSSVYAGEMEFALRLPGEPLLEMSWFGMPDWSRPSFIDATGEMKGTLETHTIPAGDEQGAAEIQLEVYRPRAIDAGERLPVVYVIDAGAAKTEGRLHEVADRLMHDKDSKTPRAVLVYVPMTIGADFGSALVSRVVPFVDRNLPTIADRRSRVAVSNGFIGGIAFKLLTEQSETFANGCVQTPLVFTAEQAAIRESFSRLERPTRLYLEWGVFDMHNPSENWDVRKIGSELFADLSGANNLTLSGGEVADSTDWISWRNRFDSVLKLLNE